jgi:hypothetical protein
MAVATIGGKTIDTDARTVSGQFTIYQDEEKKKKKVGMRSIHYTLDYSGVSDAIMFAKGSSPDIIALQNEIRKNWSDFPDGTRLSRDMSVRKTTPKLSDLERIRRQVRDSLGLSDDACTATHPMVEAMVAAWDKANA